MTATMTANDYRTALRAIGNTISAEHNALCVDLKQSIGGWKINQGQFTSAYYKRIETVAKRCGVTRDGAAKMYKACRELAAAEADLTEKICLLSDGVLAMRLGYAVTGRWCEASSMGDDMVKIVHADFAKHGFVA